MLPRRTLGAQSMTVFYLYQHEGSLGQQIIYKGQMANAKCRGEETFCSSLRENNIIIQDCK